MPRTLRDGGRSFANDAAGGPLGRKLHLLYGDANCAELRRLGKIGASDADGRDGRGRLWTGQAGALGRQLDKARKWKNGEQIRREGSAFVAQISKSAVSRVSKPAVSRVSKPAQ